jgi:hypothetical protein
MASKRPSLSESMKSLSQDPTPVPETPIAKPAKPPSVTARAEMKKLLIPVEPSLHKSLKLLAVQQDRTLEDVCRVALRSYLDIK